MRYFRSGIAGLFFKADLALGICNILVGLLLVFHSSDATILLPVSAGVYLLAQSVFDFQLAVQMHRFVTIEVDGKKIN